MLCLYGKVLEGGDWRGGSCEKASMSNGVSFYLLQVGLATVQSQAKAEPTGSTTAITYFRKGKKCCRAAGREKRENVS